MLVDRLSRPIGLGTVGAEPVRRALPLGVARLAGGGGDARGAAAGRAPPAAPPGRGSVPLGRGARTGAAAPAAPPSPSATLPTTARSSPSMVPRTTPTTPRVSSRSAPSMLVSVTKPIITGGYS